MDLFPGSSVTLRATFTVSGTATDPTTISLLVRDPQGVTNTYTYGGATVTKDSTGVYSKNVTLDTEGPWNWRWVGTGTVVAAEEGVLNVTESIFV